jgi:hypothetical protein
LSMGWFGCTLGKTCNRQESIHLFLGIVCQDSFTARKTSRKVQQNFPRHRVLVELVKMQRAPWPQENKPNSQNQTTTRLQKYKYARRNEKNEDPQKHVNQKKLGIPLLFFETIFEDRSLERASKKTRGCVVNLLFEQTSAWL